MKKTCVKVWIGPGNIKNVESLKKYLTTILPLWQESGHTDLASNDYDIIIGAPAPATSLNMTAVETKERLFIETGCIDDIMAKEETRVKLANSLKLIAAELWQQED